MSLFGCHGTLKSMDEILQQELKHVDIISDLNLTDEDFKLLSNKINAFAKHGHTRVIYTKYKVSMAVFLVFCAVYHFDDNYWPHVEQYMGEVDSDKKRDIVSRFESVLVEYNLPFFEKEGREGYRYVTPILCHAGIPINSMDLLFEVLEDTFYNISFLHGHILDEFNYILDYRLNMPIKRYLRYLGEDAEEFLQDLREFMLTVENKDISKKEGFDMFPQIQPRYIERYFLWRELPREAKTGANRGKILFANPKLKIDITGMGVYFILPEQRIADTYEDKVEWQLIYGQEAQDSHAVIAYLYIEDGDIFSEEKIIIVKPSSEYTINLYLESELIYSWKFKGIKGNSDYIFFNNNNDLIKTNYLPKQSITLICTRDLSIDDFGLAVLEIPPLPKWQGFKFYRLDLKETNVLSLYNTNHFEDKIHIDIRQNRKPKLLGGRLLFDEYPSRESFNNNYIELPTIGIYREKSMNMGKQCELWMVSIENKKKNTTSTISLSDVDVVDEYDGMILIPLDNPRLINKGDYGDYTIKLIEKQSVKGRFYIRYIPEIELYIEPDAFWPCSVKGYESKYFYCRHPSYVDIEIDNATFEDKDIINGREYSKFSILDNSHMLYGKIVITSYYGAIDMDFKTFIRPIYWGWMGFDGKGSLTWSNRCHTMSLADIEADDDVFLVLGAGNGVWKSLTVQLKLIDSSGNVYQDEALTVDRGKITSIPMNKYLTTIQDGQCDIFYLIMDISVDGIEKVAQAVIARIQEEIVYDNMVINKDKGSLLFSWNEEGSGIDRELVIYNYNMPWCSPEVIYVEDKVVGTEINLGELSLSSSNKYGVKLRRISSDTFFDDVTFVDIPKISDLKGFKINEDNSEHENLAPIDTLLQYMLGYIHNKISHKRVRELFEILPKKIDESDIYKISVSYLFFRKNPPRGKQMAHYIKVIFSELFYRYSKGACKYAILRALASANFSKKDFEELILKWNIINSPVDRNVSFSPSESQYLWDTMPLLGFLVDIRTNPIDKLSAVNRICEWVGQVSISSLIGKQISHKDCILDGDSKKDLRGCLKVTIWEGCSCSKIGLKLDTDNLGSKSHVNKFFNTIQQSNKFMYLSDDEIYAEYDRSGGDTGLRLCGKTYLKAFVDIKQNTAYNKWNNMAKNYSELYKQWDVNWSAFTDLGNRKRIEVIKVLMKRRDIEGGVAEYCGLTAYLSSLAARATLPADNYLYGLTEFSYRNMQELFIRDYIIFELYHSIGGCIKDVT